MRELDGITHLTFDCYGTLIDWETGILRALRSLFESHGVAAAPDAILRLYVAHEARVEGLVWRPYRDILRDVTDAIAQDLGVRLSISERNLLPETIGSWPPFEDTIAALRRLKERFRLAILSNVDNALFTETAKQLQVAFDDIITAEEVRSYKPGEAHFREAPRRLNVPVTRILHVAQSLYHDHVPAKRLGFRTVWVKRPSRLTGTGLAPTASVQPDLIVPDLAKLVVELLDSR